LLLAAAAARPDPGLAVGAGLLIGLVTGAIFVLLLLRIAEAARKSRAKGIAAAISECLSLPGFWFGGPWLSGHLLSGSGLDAAVNYYSLTLAAVFILIVGLPLYQLVAQTARKLRDG
jgi:hypothetical protein